MHGTFFFFFVSQRILLINAYLCKPYHVLCGDSDLGILRLISLPRLPIAEDSEPRRRLTAEYGINQKSLRLPYKALNQHA